MQYLVCNHGHMVSQDELIGVIIGNEECENPVGTSFKKSSYTDCVSYWNLPEYLENSSSIKKERTDFAIPYPA